MGARALAIGLAAAAITAAPLAGAATLDDGHGRVCYPRELWSARDGGRPCAKVRVFEDASVRVATGTANGARAYWACTLPAADGGRPHCERIER